MKLYTKFKIKVIYKSGASHEFWCWEFSRKNGKYEWINCEDSNKPIMLGVDEVAAVYQVGYKTVFRFIPPLA